MALSTVLQVLTIGIVSLGHGALSVAVHLDGVRHVGILTGEDRNLRHPGSKPSTDVGRCPLVPRVERHLGLHAYYFIAGIEEPKVVELLLVDQVTVTGCEQRGCRGTRYPHRAKHLSSRHRISPQGL